ncbi:MAG: FAD/NAD(P)-binding oxidoreductase [Dehalococcoidia bacterium]|nr:FAD/NAD(P)-binding oxidoreductase [Dehalococcoidia bacterium]
MQGDRTLARDIRGEIEKQVGEQAAVSVGEGIARLSGRCSSHDTAVQAGFLAAGFDRIREVVNDLVFPGKMRFKPRRRISEELTGKEFDVVIVGGGVIGLAVARELSQFDLSIALFERHNDLGMDQTSHSCAMIHPAIQAEYGTLRWEMNYRGNAMWDETARQLDVDFRRVGTLIVAETQEEEKLLPYVLDMAAKHNDPEPKLLDREGLDRVEPGLVPHVTKGVLIWNTGIISVFELVIAYAENALSNGVSIFLDTSVLGIHTEDSAVRAVDTDRGTVRARILINAAGLYADRIAEYAGDRFFTIHPRKGETIIFDKSYQPVRTVFAPVSMAAESRESKHSKGGGIIPTTDGNLQFGPTAFEVCDREDVATTAEGCDSLYTRFAPLLERLKPEYEKPDRGKIITQFAGCRAATYKEDFIIEPSRKVRGLVHAAGIQSPGLASAPAIAERIREIARDEWLPSPNEDFDPVRKRQVRLAELQLDDQDKLIRDDQLYGHIVCRCEDTSEAEVVRALHGPLAARSVDGVKRRTRAGQGRCQGGFCMPRIVEIISREMDTARHHVVKSDGRSYILSKRTK